MKTLLSLCAAAVLFGAGVARADDRANCDEKKADISADASQSQQSYDQNKQVKHHHEVQKGSDVRTGYEMQPSDDAASKIQRGANEAGAAVGSATEEALHPSRMNEHLDKGEIRGGKDVRNTVTTNAVGLVDGTGLNVQLEKPFAEKWSGVVGARYARASAGGSSTTAFGANGGVDYFIYGRRNEGLSIGPRLNLGAGTNTTVSSELLGQIGLAGELGYTYIANNGLSAGAAGGVGFNVGGTLSGEPNSVTNSAPYGRINLGYSW